MLDHAGHRVVAPAHHPAVAGRVVEHRGQQRGRVVVGPVGADQRGQGARAQQRRVAGQHHDVAVVAGVLVGQPGEGHGHGVARCRAARPARRTRWPGRAGACSTRVLVTHSARWPTTTTTRSMGSSASASSTWRIMGRPHSRCRGFGRSERIRVPSPAARTTADSGRRGEPVRDVPTRGGLPVVGRPLRVGPDHHGATPGGRSARRSRRRHAARRSWAYSSHVGRLDATRRRHTFPHQGIIEPMPVLPTAIDPALGHLPRQRGRAGRGPGPGRRRAGRRPGPAGASGT